MDTAYLAACIALTWLAMTGGPVGVGAEPVCHSKFDYDEKLLSKMLTMEFNYNKQVESCNEREKLMHEQLTALRERSMNLSKAFATFKEEVFQMIGHLEANTSSIETERDVELLQLKTEIDEKFKEAAQPFISQGPVAFAAQKVKNIDVAIGDKIVYKEVLLDTDGGYDVNTGVFTAPRDGIYLFSTQSYVYSGRSLGLGLMACGKQITRGNRDSMDKFSSYTVVGVGQLLQGQEAYVVIGQRSPGTGDLMYDSAAYNNFQGVLIHA